MTTDRRDREVGAGYDYQWDVATYLLVAYLLSNNKSSQDELREAFDWLGPIESVFLEGWEAEDRLEDVNLFGQSGRCLRIQVKETNEDVTKGVWRPRTGIFVKFLNRLGLNESRPNQRTVFLTNGTISADLRELLGSPQKLMAFYEEIISTTFEPEKRGSRERFLANCGSVTPCTFLAASPADGGAATSGVGRAIINELVVMRVAAPEIAYVRLRAAVMKWSFRSGGTRLTIPQLRLAILELLGLSSIASGGPWVINFVDYLKGIEPESQNWPSWTELEKGAVWQSDPVVRTAKQMLMSDGMALLVGGQGSGKTVATRALAHHLHAEGFVPIYWDFENLGELPVMPGEFWQGAIAHAHVAGGRALVVLENVHLDPGSTKTILGLHESMRDAGGSRVALIITSRTEITAPRGRVSVEATEERGFALLDWWIRERLKLDDRAWLQVRAAVPWSRYLHDFWLLTLSLHALNVETRSLPMWAIETKLRERLERTIGAAPGVDDLLYLISGLGRSGVATDLEAAARALNLPRASVQQFAERAHLDGLVSIQRDRRTCRFWHDSLADSYWRVFAQERGRWAQRARELFEASP